MTACRLQTLKSTGKRQIRGTPSGSRPAFACRPALRSRQKHIFFRSFSDIFCWSQPWNHWKALKWTKKLKNGLKNVSTSTRKLVEIHNTYCHDVDSRFLSITYFHWNIISLAGIWTSDLLSTKPMCYQLNYPGKDNINKLAPSTSMRQNVTVGPKQADKFLDEINYKIGRKIISIIRSEIHGGIESLLIQPFYWGYFSMMQCDVVQNCTWRQPQNVYLATILSHYQVH